MQEIDARRLKELIEAGAAPEIVDIREAEEYSAAHIHGSRNLPVYNALLSDREEALIERSDELPRDRSIVTVCRMGRLSRRAAALLGSLGYDACSLSGGMQSWGGVWSEAPIDAESASTFVQIRRNGKGCLSYLFGKAGKAAVVDPCVEIGAYLDAASRAGLEITHVLETHVHADHVSRARELCRATGARLVLPPNDRVTYPYTAARDGERITAGGMSVEVVATPGHTGESVCYRVADQILLTGDTLFAESVGRPDLERGDAGAEDGARLLYGSLRALLERFPDARFYPCHTGSPIAFDRTPLGSSMSEAVARIDLLRSDEETFVREVLSRLGAKPGNHERIISLNEGKADAEGLDMLALEAGPNQCAAG